MFREIFLSESIYATKIIPKYIQVSLDNYPLTTRIETLVLSINIIADILPTRAEENKEIALFCIQTQADKLYESLSRKKAVPRMFILSLLHVVTICDLSILLPTLNILEELITSVPAPARYNMCQLLQMVILRNFDMMRKSIIVNWYLNLLSLVGLNVDLIDVPAATEKLGSQGIQAKL